MIIDALKPIDLCGSDLAANEIHVSCSRRLVSPDGRWQVVVRGDDGPALNIQLGRPFTDRAAVADASGRVIATFSMERSARIYWLRDGRGLVVNYFAGSDATRPLMIRLDRGRTKPVDVSAVLLPDVLKRVHKRYAQLYHYYVWFTRERGDRLTIVAEPESTLHGTTGPGGGNCLVYSVEKANFHYRFLGEADPDGNCPAVPGEKP